MSGATTTSPNHTTASGTPPAEGDDRPATGPALAALLACFAGERRAGKARRPLESLLRAGANRVYDTTVLRVDNHHAATVHDPRRVVAGTLTPLLTWGAFGLVTGGIASMIASGLLGALCGGFFAYRNVHHATKTQLARLGRALPSNSSALLTFTQTSDARALLEQAVQHGASAASVAVMENDLSAHVVASAAQDPQEAPDGGLQMILVRYPDPAAAAKAAASAAKDVEIELVVSTQQSGGRHVSDPRFGPAALGRSNIVSWGALGLVCGALAGITGDNGLLGFLASGLVTAVIWALFGLAAGALYGLWAGRSMSAHRLKGLDGLLPPGTSALLAWTDTPLHSADLTTGGSERLVLGFTPTDDGAMLAIREDNA